jgi:hypothetical protein
MIMSARGGGVSWSSDENESKIRDTVNALIGQLTTLHELLLSKMQDYAALGEFPFRTFGGIRLQGLLGRIVADINEVSHQLAPTAVRMVTRMYSVFTQLSFTQAAKM